MNETDNVEEIFNAILNKFTEISKQVEVINKSIENIGINFTNSMVQVSDQINSLANSLQSIMNIEELTNLKQSIHEIVQNFRKELDPMKIQKLLSDLAAAVQIIKKI
ncbi:MAG: hypothetical protein ACFFD2_21020 [Promethearchaeota archaeon]